MKNILRIIKIAKPIHRLLFLLCFLILSTAVLQQLTPILMKFMVDEIMAQIQTQSGNMTRLGWLIGISFSISIINNVVSSISNRIGDHVSGKMRLYLTGKFYDKVMRLPMSYFDGELSGQVLSKLARGIVVVQGFLNNASNFILPMFIQTFFTIAILAYFNIPTALFVTLLFPIYLYLTKLSTEHWGKLEVEKNAIEDKINGRAQEVVANMKVVKSFGNELREYSYVLSNLNKHNEIYAKQSNNFHKIDFLRNFSLDFILIVVTVIIFYNTFQGLLTVGEMVLIIQLVNQARWPLFGMSYILTQVQQAESGSKSFFEILEKESVEHYDQTVKREKLENPTIEFKNVKFAYEESEMVLDDLNFKIGNKEKVALVGHSGAGKSTLVNLILKLYEPTEGEICLKDKKYSKMVHREVRENMSLVLQENELFSLSIRENILYGREATDEDIIEALKQANAYDFVMKLPKGLDSEVGERGVRLSGGQKQRIQIARAILHNTPILILDEATSNLDSKSEKEIQNALEKLMKDKLVVIIAHRFSTIQNVDRILVIDEGKLVDSGKPQELAKKKGVYSDLLRYQIEGNKKLLKGYDLFR